MAVVKWRRRANNWRRDVLLYGKREFGIIVARKLNNRIESATELLALNPYMGKIEPLLEGRSVEYRSLVVHKLFKLIYYVDDAADTLYIVDLWDVRKEPKALTEPLNQQ